MKVDALVLGGGITGLTAAYRLSKKVGSVALVEAAPRLGGVLRTESHEGFLIEGGADSIVAGRAPAMTLFRDLGLSQSLIPTREENRRVYVAFGGDLHPLPEGMVLAVPTRVMPLVRTRLFSWPGKMRMALDLVLPRSDSTADESLATFLRRRLGEELTDRLAGPLLAGIYSGDPERLSVRSTFPMLVEMEREHRSLILAALARRPKRRAGPPPSMFLSLRGGMGELVGALEGALESAGVDVRRDTRVERIERGERTRFVAHLKSGETIEADHTIATGNAHAIASVVETLDPGLSTALRAIEYGSTATVVLAYEKAKIAHPLDATGIILPKQPGVSVLALTFSSSKWEGRAPEGCALIRAYLGGHRDPDVVNRLDEELESIARNEIAALVGARGEPLFARVFRHRASRPQPTVGHDQRLVAIFAAAKRHPGLHIAGAGFGGVGIPDCIAQAERVAQSIAAG